MSEKQITNRNFANLKLAIAAMSDFATQQQQDVFLQKIVYGPRKEINPFFSLQTHNTDDQEAINSIIDNFENSGIEYILRTADEIINLNCDIIKKKKYNGIPDVKESEIDEKNIHLTDDEIRKGIKRIGIKEKCETPYAEFHRKNIGFQFAMQKEGTKNPEIFDKLTIFTMFADDQEAIDLLCENEHPVFKRIDKKGWKNGILIPKTYYGRKS